MEKETALKIHKSLYNNLSDFLNVHELTHAANEIITNPTEETIGKMSNYLCSFDTIRMGQSYLLPTATVRGLTANNVRIAMNEVRDIIKADTQAVHN